jgi:hypothetical protein
MIQNSKVCSENAQFNRETGQYVIEHRNSPKIPMGDLFQKRKVTIPKMSSKEMVMGIQEQVLNEITKIKIKKEYANMVAQTHQIQEKLVSECLKKE